MAPVVQALQAHPAIESQLCVTAQHRGMLDQVLSLFNLVPDVDLNLMRPNQQLGELTINVLRELPPVLAELKPHIVLVHGDTTTTMATSLACFYNQIPLGHVEAGLRTYNKAFPYPEEMNRVLTDTVADLHFAPTQRSVEQLQRLGAPDEGIVLTGNTVIDALHHTLAQTQASTVPVVSLEAGQRLVLVTVHRRENFGEPLQAILRALLALLATHPDVVLALPVHPNPNVKQAVEKALGAHPRVTLLPPQEYAPFCQLMAEATLILTDSGGVQEEAPSLGKPVLVLRNQTERPEAVEAGTVKLVGASETAIVAEASELLSNPVAYATMQRAINPYGDGHATGRIVQALLNWHMGQSPKNAGLPWSWLH